MAQLLHGLSIALSSRHASSSSRATASAVCAALRGSVCHQGAGQGRSPRRQATPRAAEAAQAGQARSPSGAPASGGSPGGSGGGGGLAWEPVQAALDRRQPREAWYEFMELLEQGAQPPAALCDRLISALCAAQQFQQAWRAYSAVQPTGTCLQYNTYQALISQALKSGAVEFALEAFRDLQSQGLTANVITYCGVISALGRERRRGTRHAATAADLWSELEGSGVQLDAAAYRAGMKALVDVGRLKDAERLLQPMAAAAGGQPPDARAYNILLAGHARAGRTSAMGRLMQRMVAAGVQPCVVTFNTMVDGYVRAGDLAAARGVLARAGEAEVALDAWSYSTLIKGHVQAGQLAAAETVLGDMAAAGVRPTCVTFSTLVEGHVRAGDLAAARRVMEAMVAAGEAPNTVTFNSLLKGYAAAALAAAGQPGSSGGKAGGRSGGGRRGAQAAKPPSAAASSAAPAPASTAPVAAAQQGGPASSPSPSSSALWEALDLLEEMQGRGVRPAADTFNTLMAAAVGVGEPGLALELHSRLRAQGLRPDGLTFTTLIKAHGRLGQVAEAVACFEALLRDRSAQADLPAYNAVVDALARNGDMPDAERMLGAACEFATKQGLPAPVEAFGAVVAGYVRQKELSSAVATVRRFHAAGGSPDAQMLDLLANAAIRAGDYKVAMQSVRALELIGRDVDKARYAAMLEEARAAQQAQQGGAGVPADDPSLLRGHNRSFAEYQRRREAKRKNVQLERFKFWLGLPNSYYSSDSEADQQQQQQAGAGVDMGAEDWASFDQREWGRAGRQRS